MTWAKTRLQQEAVAALLEAALDQPNPTRRLAEAASWAASCLKHKEALRGTDIASTSGDSAQAGTVRSFRSRQAETAGRPRSIAEASEAVALAGDLLPDTSAFGTESFAEMVEW